MSSSWRRVASVLVVLLAWGGCSYTQRGLRDDASSELRSNSQVRSNSQDRSSGEVEKPVDTKDPEQDPRLADSVDRDGDGDGLTDDVDPCPEAAELYNGVDDDDGCPDTGPHGIRLNGSGSMLLHGERIYYTTGKSDVRPKSVPQIVELGQVLKQNPLLGVIRIEVHTENIGSDEYNLELSQRRADHVRNLLLQAGVAGERLKAVGKGELVPIVREAFTQTRIISRRTEFWIEGPSSRDPQ